MPRGGLRDPPGGRPKGSVTRKLVEPRRAIRAAAAEYGAIAIRQLGRMLERAEEADRPVKAGETQRERPRDSDIIMAAEKLLDRGYGKSVPASAFQGLFGSYDWSKLNPEQLRTFTEILRIAAPTDAVGETD